MRAENCFHCGLPVADKDDFSVLIDGQSRAMCCLGCRAVASAIVDGGLAEFYQYRSANSTSKADAERLETEESFAAYDLPEVQCDLLSLDEQGLATIELRVSGISCAACAWLIEHHLGQLTGISKAAVNVSRQRCRVQWALAELPLSKILSAFTAIGFRAYPARESSSLQHIERDQRGYLLRLGVAGIGMMQAGMLAIALYAGAFQGMDEHWQSLLRWVSLVVATPVVLYSAQPFFYGAWRSLIARHLIMDVPVALAIALAYSASVWATLSKSGEVYFDAVSMLTFFLLLGRFLEMRVRYRNELVAGEVTELIPLTALRYSHQGEIGLEAGELLRPVPVKSLCVGDVIQVGEGERLPVDGVVLAGKSAVIEAVLTGEQDPVVKALGDLVSAGTVNTSNPLKIEVRAVGRATRLAAIVDMLDDVSAEKPQQVALADRIASWFVALVLVVAVTVFTLWWWYDPDRALWVTLSVLVVTCPCALSLATPVALAAATGQLQRQGFLVRSVHVLQTLARVTRVVLDKTGTLTTGKLEIDRVLMVRAQCVREGQKALSTEAVLDIAAALERDCRHPIAIALKQRKTSLQVDGLSYQVGAGVTGTIDGQLYALGKPAFMTEVFALALSGGLTHSSHREEAPNIETASGQGEQQSKVEVILASQQGEIARIVLSDVLRPGAKDVVAQFAQQGLGPELLSGDQEKNTAAVAASLGIAQWRGNNTPEDKLAYIRAQQERGEVVLMVGDGINDVPVLSGADISVAMAEASDFTRQASDAVLLSGNLNTLLAAIILARRTGRVIRQNMAWALVYNLSALPLAALGWVPPWAAAIGMSLSSLFVVLNALRLQRSDSALGASTVSALHGQGTTMTAVQSGL